MFCLQLAYFHGNFVRLQSSRLSFFIPAFWSGFWLFWLQQNGKDSAFSTHPTTSVLLLLFSCFVLRRYSSQSADDWDGKIHLYRCFLLIFLPPSNVRKKKCNKPLLPNIFIGRPIQMEADPNTLFCSAERYSPHHVKLLQEARGAVTSVNIFCTGVVQGVFKAKLLTSCEVQKDTHVRVAGGPAWGSRAAAQVGRPSLGHTTPSPSRPQGAHQCLE